MKTIDLSGYSFSGKSAVYDFLSEFDGYQCHSKEFEFDLLRVPGGILDLENALIHNWSPVRSSEAIRRFKKLIKTYGGTDSYLSRLSSIGYQYDKFFPGFTSLSEEYIDSLISTSWGSEWPFALNDLPVLTVFYKKLLSKAGVSNAFEFDVYLSRPTEDEFLDLTRSFLSKLLSGPGADKPKNILLNNSFEPFYPLRSHRYFSNPKSIIVDRDPRDIYISALQQGVVGKVNVGRAAIGSSVDDYIQRFKAYRLSNYNDHNNILKLNFESLVTDYESTKSKIIKFLGEDETVHVRPGESFDPSVSINGVGQWKKVTGSLASQINTIYSELNEYCIDI